MLERLNQLETNVAALKNFKQKYNIEHVKHDIHLQWTLRYGLFESIQIVIDIACHLTANYNLGNPASYAECIELLNKENYINDKLMDKLLGMAGLRNILIHEYVSIDLEKLYSLLNQLDDFSEFADAVKDLL